MGKIRYEVISVIKESNKGTVCLASMEEYAFPVIVKRLKKGNRKVYEALQKAENKHVPKIYCLEEDAEGLLIAEEYIEGELLSEYLTRWVLTEAEYLSIAKQLCEGLGMLHQCNPPIIHRDIKPSNIIINSEGIVKIIDFDSSRQYKEESESDTRLLGTEKYAAPEQYGFSQTDCRSDIYSLGVVFGMFPEFTSKGRKRRWKKLVERCTLFAPESRFQTVAQVNRAVRKIEHNGMTGWEKICVTVAILLFLSGLGVLLHVFNAEKETIVLPTPESSEESEPTAGLTPKPRPTETAGPTDSPTSSPIPTEEPEPTATSAPTATPTPSPTPTKEPTPEVSVTPEEAYRTTAPEWRDIENEPEVYVVLKQELRDRNGVVMNCFKDRLGDRDFLIQVKALERPDTEYSGVVLYSYLSGRWLEPEERYVELRDGIVHLDGDYMKELPDGYYKISVRINRKGETFNEHGVTLYVAASDMLEEPGWWLQNTTFTYYGDAGGKINGVVKNDSGTEIAGLLYMQREVDKSLYRIHCDGRAIEFSEELLQSKSSRDLVLFQVLGTDGSIVDVQITNDMGE